MRQPDDVAPRNDPMQAHDAGAVGDAPDDRETSPDADAASDTRTAGKEVGGPKGPEPTRYGDWERNGRCYDF